MAGQRRLHGTGRHGGECCTARFCRLGAAAATGQIAYTGGAVEGCWSEAAYDGSGTLVTHDLVVEGMA